MNDKAMWELAEYLKSVNEGGDPVVPEWLTTLKGLPVEDYAQDLCRALHVGLFAFDGTVSA